MSMISIDDYTVPPNMPEARGMRVIGVFPEFDYVNSLANGYGTNIAKEEGVDEVVRDTIRGAIKDEQWKPAHYNKPATMEKTDVEGINNLLTGFTTLAAHIGLVPTMFIYLVEFFDAPDHNGVMQTADYWRRAWRTKENVEEKYDHIKSKYKKKNILRGAADLLNLGSYTPNDEGVYQRSNIVAVLKSIGIANPTDTWVNDVRENINPSVGVMTNADDFDVSDNPKLKKSVIIETKTFGQKSDPKMDSQTVDALEEQIVNQSKVIEKKLKNDEKFDITVVGKTLGVRIEKADEIREIKPSIILDIYKKRYNNYMVIDNLIKNHGFDLEEALQFMWRGQKPDEESGEIYVA